MNRTSKIEFRPTYEFSFSELASILNACFSEYVVPHSLTAATFDNRFRRDHLDLTISRVVMERGRPIAISLIARRGWTARVAAIGIVPEYRGRGFGGVLLRGTIDAARLQGDRRIILEVIETNRPAVQLYHRCGFAVARRLVGYSLPVRLRSSRDLALAECDPREIAGLLACEGVSLPWTLAPEGLAAVSAPARGVTLDGVSWAIIEPASRPATLILDVVFTKPEARRQGWGRDLVAAITREYPEQTLAIHSNWPEELAGDFLRKTGFERTAISRLEMARDLTPSAESTRVSVRR